MAKDTHVVFANEYDREDIIDIWEKCFGDEREYVKMYLDNRFETENMFVIYEDGRPVSMASFLPVNIFIEGEYVSAKYVYAVATLPQYRNKGYAAEILKYASQKYNEPLILQPENDELVKYYEKLGFVTGFKDSPCWVYEYRTCELMAAEYSEFTAEDITPIQYKDIRDGYFENEGYVQWDEKAIEYAIKENEYCGGKTQLINGKDLIMYRIEQDRLHVIESTLDDGKMSMLLPYLMDSLKLRCAYLRNHGGMILFPQNAKSKGFDEGYLALTLG
jgi:hypothetical protein